MSSAAHNALQSYYAQPWAGANPNSLHEYGRCAFAALERSRKVIAQSIGAASPHEIIFTSGGTEADNTAVLKIASAVRRTHPERDQIAISSIEHEAIDQLVKPLNKLGFVVHKLPITQAGIIDLEYFKSLCDTEGTHLALVSVMQVNNEIGTVQPIKEIGDCAHRVGALVHTDAVQAVGHIPVHVQELGVDALTLTAHKLGGPVGIGALYVKRKTPLEPLLMGGGQERGYRSGTQDVAGACAFAAALQERVENLSQVKSALESIRDQIYRDLDAKSRGAIKPVIPYEFHKATHPGMVCITVEGQEAETLILKMSEQGFMIASGSACSSSSQEPSHVLKALNVPRSRIYGALRVSFDERVSRSDLIRFADALVSCVVSA